MAQRLGRGIALLFHDRGTRRWWVVSSTPRPHFTPGTHFTGGWVGSRAGSGRAENLIPTGIRSRTVQPVVSRCTDWATGPTDGINNYPICTERCTSYQALVQNPNIRHWDIQWRDTIHLSYCHYICIKLHSVDSRHWNRKLYYPVEHRPLQILCVKPQQTVDITHFALEAWIQA